jgi:hypothetical protein
MHYDLLVYTELLTITYLFILLLLPPNAVRDPNYKHVCENHIVSSLRVITITKSMFRLLLHYQNRS